MELWPGRTGTSILRFGKANAVLFLLRGGFSDAGRWAEAGIAMAGTGTEQLVGPCDATFSSAADFKECQGLRK